MSGFPCPHCGGEILAVPGTSPLPGWRDPALNGVTSPAQSGGAISPVAQGSEGLTTKDGRRAYNQDYPPEFVSFWIVYPRHRDKRKAARAWRNAIRRASPETIRAGAIRYRDDPNRLDEFTKYAEGWLNGDGWEDEPLPPRIDRTRRPDPPRSMTSGEMDRAVEDEIERSRRG